MLTSDLVTSDVITSVLDVTDLVTSDVFTSVRVVTEFVSSDLVTSDLAVSGDELRCSFLAHSGREGALGLDFGES